MQKTTIIVIVNLGKGFAWHRTTFVCVVQNHETKHHGDHKTRIRPQSPIIALCIQRAIAYYIGETIAYRMRSSKRVREYWYNQSNQTSLDQWRLTGFSVSLSLAHSR